MMRQILFLFILLGCSCTHEDKVVKDLAAACASKWEDFDKLNSKKPYLFKKLEDFREEFRDSIDTAISDDYFFLDWFYCSGICDMWDCYYTQHLDKVQVFAFKVDTSYYLEKIISYSENCNRIVYKIKEPLSSKQWDAIHQVFNAYEFTCEREKKRMDGENNYTRIDKFSLVLKQGDKGFGENILPLEDTMGATFLAEFLEEFSILPSTFLEIQKYRDKTKGHIRLYMEPNPRLLVHSLTTIELKSGNFYKQIYPNKLAFEIEVNPGETDFLDCNYDDSFFRGTLSLEHPKNRTRETIIDFSISLARGYRKPM